MPASERRSSGVLRMTGKRYALCMVVASATGCEWVLGTDFTAAPRRSRPVAGRDAAEEGPVAAGNGGFEDDAAGEGGNSGKGDGGSVGGPGRSGDGGRGGHAGTRAGSGPEAGAGADGGSAAQTS